MEIPFLPLLFASLLVCGCGKSSPTPAIDDGRSGPIIIADYAVNNERYQQLCDEVWFLGIGMHDDVISFFEQGIISVSPTKSKGFIPRIYGVKSALTDDQGNLVIQVFDFMRDEGKELDEFTIKVSLIFNSECEIFFKNHNGRYMTEEKQIENK